MLVYSTNGGTNWTANNAAEQALLLRDFDFPGHPIRDTSCGGRCFQDGFTGANNKINRRRRMTLDGIDHFLHPFEQLSAEHSVDFVNENTGWVGGSSETVSLLTLIGKTTRRRHITWVQNRRLETNPPAWSYKCQDAQCTINGFAIGVLGLYSPLQTAAHSWPRTYKHNCPQQELSLAAWMFINKDVIFLSSQDRAAQKK
jgi:hypothetical protein